MYVSLFFVIELCGAWSDLFLCSNLFFIFKIVNTVFRYVSIYVSNHWHSGYDSNRNCCCCWSEFANVIILHATQPVGPTWVVRFLKHRGGEQLLSGWFSASATLRRSSSTCAGHRLQNIALPAACPACCAVSFGRWFCKRTVAGVTALLPCPQTDSARVSAYNILPLRDRVLVTSHSHPNDQIR